MEYSNGMLSAFFNISGSNSAYKRIDYFKKKDLILKDTTYMEALGTSMNVIDNKAIMIEDTIWHNGNFYTRNSDEAKLAETDWVWIRTKKQSSMPLNHLSVFLGVLNW